jgi:plastocyanin
MKIWPVIFALVFLAVGELTSRAATHFVQMVNFSFAPRDLSVEVGDTVIWTNTVITGHDTVSQGVWASALLPRRGTFAFTFNVAPGTYNYVCTPHVSFGMVGTVTVRAPVNTPPTVVIDSPVNGQTFLVGQTINVSVTATDNVGVTKVDLIVDGVFAQMDGAAPFQFSLNLGPGSHTILARATDTGGLTGESAITVNVQFANPAPVVTLTSPTNGATFNEPAVVLLSADVAGAVERVEFLTNGVVVASDTTAPYSVTNTFARGAYSVTARGVDADGQIGASLAAQIEVGERLPSPPTVFFLSPSHGEYVAFASNIVLRAQVIDDDSGIAQVRFMSGSNVLGAVTSPVAPNIFELVAFLPEGIHTIFATATDTTGLSSSSFASTFTVQMAATNTYRTNIAPGVVRLGFFGSSGLPYVFEYSTNMANWIPFRTNQFYRRIYFFDAESPTNEPMRFYRARSPLFVPQQVVEVGSPSLENNPPPVFTNP